ARAGAARLLHADGAADDRGGEPVAVLLHAADRVARPDWWPVRRAEPQLARRPAHGDGLPVGDDGVEGSGLLHDLLPGGAADAAAGARGGGEDRGRLALVLLP